MDKGPTDPVAAVAFEEAVRITLIVIWEASDQVCGKRLKALLSLLLLALQCNHHLNLGIEMRRKILSMKQRHG
ncbi:hypothetical protein ACETRX_35690 [Labrys portucalensis]|uniref:Uncharacterized protein n=1 Tax=Labrys neptuniae TaxID=376174 RepID=A0ABV6ZS34_9HYPH